MRGGGGGGGVYRATVQWNSLKETMDRRKEVGSRTSRKVGASRSRNKTVLGGV